MQTAECLFAVSVKVKCGKKCQQIKFEYIFSNFKNSNFV